MFFSRCMTQLQFVRGGRRTCRPPAWFVPKKDKLAYAKKQSLTKQNIDFLDELVEDKYRHVVQSPLREAPWERNEWTMRY